MGKILAICTSPRRGTVKTAVPSAVLTPAVSYTHLRAHETDSYLVCRLLLEKKKENTTRLPLFLKYEKDKQYLYSA